MTEIGCRASDTPQLRLSKQNAVVFAWLVTGGTLLVGLVMASIAEWWVVGTAVAGAVAYAGNVVAFGARGDLRTFLNGFTLISVFATVALRFTMRGIPNGEMVLLGGLTWVAGAALTGRMSRLVRVAALFFAVVVGTEAAIWRFPPEPRTFPAWFAPVIFACAVITLTVWVAWLIYPLARGRRELADALAKEHDRSERLLLNVLPPSIAARLKDSSEVIADRCENATVLFADIVGFTTMSARMAPEALVKMLDEIFSEFDELVKRYGLEKIKTIGDAYMAAAGVPLQNPNHAAAAAGMALDMLDAVAELNRDAGLELKIRIGLNTGTVIAGVIGKQKFSYDLWGDAVNTAARMESHGLPGHIQLSDTTKAKIGEGFITEDRGTVEMKGKGQMHTWLLRGRQN